MCGRYALHSHPDVVGLQFNLSTVPQFAARYNIAPTAEVLIVRRNGAALARWGLRGKFHNSRAETVAAKPVFREAYRRRRCLIPANGFYEWKQESGRKQPYYVRPAGGELFAFAGLWETWQELETCAVITTEANPAMRQIHDRMPLILSREQYANWLGGDESLLASVPATEINAYPVSTAVNRAANDSRELIEPLGSSFDRQVRAGRLFGD